MSLQTSPSAASSWSNPCLCGRYRRCCPTLLWMRWGAFRVYKVGSFKRVHTWDVQVILFNCLMQSLCLFSDLTHLLSSTCQQQAVDLDKWVCLLRLSYFTLSYLYQNLTAVASINQLFCHNTTDDSSSAFSTQSSQGGGHRTLLYGHAILLKHTHSSMVSTFALSVVAAAHILLSELICCCVLSPSLRCSTWAVWLHRAPSQTNWLLMSACRKTPQVAMNVFLPKMSITHRCRFFILYISITGEACWWTIHPASKQRSEGEKVRVGDDLILVSVSSERYLVTTIAFT